MPATIFGVEARFEVGVHRCNRLELAQLAIAGVRVTEHPLLSEVGDPLDRAGQLTLVCSGDGNN
jgi:hypothetical protein